MTEKLRKKYEGYSWLLGVYIIMTALTLMLMILGWYRITGDAEIAEDEITASVLGSMIYDRPSHALDKEHMISEFVKHNCENYNSLCHLLELNFNYERVPYNIGGITTSGFRLSGSSQTTIYLPKTIYYCKDVTGKWLIHEYTSNGVSVEKKFYEQNTSPVTPNGTVIEKTSCYVNMIYPIRFMGIEYANHKEMTVALK
ncbi:MAG: hypothetical protein K6E95_00670 [Lachnospiraceae bacterium]|nr:hypothetical protein [Lachnospiraceae bacterium]